MVSATAERNRKNTKSFPGKVGCLIVCFYHVPYEFESESTLYSCLNVKELLARSRRHIWRLSDCNGTRTHNHLVRKRTLNHLANAFGFCVCPKWLSVRLRTKWLWVRVPLQSLKVDCEGTLVKEPLAGET